MLGWFTFGWREGFMFQAWQIFKRETLDRLRPTNRKGDVFPHGPLPPAVPWPRLMRLVLSPGFQPTPAEQLYWACPPSPLAYLAPRTCTWHLSSRPLGCRLRPAEQSSPSWPPSRHSAPSAPSQSSHSDTPSSPTF